MTQKKQAKNPVTKSPVIFCEAFILEICQKS